MPLLPRHTGVVLGLLLVCSPSCSRSRVPFRAPAVGAGWSYEVLATPAGELLAVEASFPPGTGAEFGVDDGGAPFLRDVVASRDDQPLPVAFDGDRWSIGCGSGCRLRYQYRLGDAARASDDRNVAEVEPGGVQAPASTWLLRPLEAATGTPYRFHVTAAPGDVFVTGVSPVHGAPDTYEAFVAADTLDLPYGAFGRLRRASLADGHVEVAFLPGPLRDEAAVRGWIEGAARAVEGYYGGAPIPRVLVLVNPVGGDRGGEATTMGGSGAAIDIAVGRDATAESLRDDWVLVHEMVHTALPNIDRSHHWLEEGIATYVEPLVRARAGIIPPARVWHDWVADMPKGLPEPGDEGLDRTHTWGRTYWGGAVFCLAVDVAIRQRTDNRRSLRDALLGIVAHGGNIAVGWPIEKVLDVGDAATGVTVLRETYQRMATRPEGVDLERLWADLGIRRQGDSLVFDDEAPLAAIRRAMVTGPP